MSKCVKLGIHAEETLQAMFFFRTMALHAHLTWLEKKNGLTISTIMCHSENVMEPPFCVSSNCVSLAPCNPHTLCMSLYET